MTSSHSPHPLALQLLCFNCSYLCGFVSNFAVSFFFSFVVSFFSLHFDRSFGCILTSACSTEEPRAFGGSWASDGPAATRPRAAGLQGVLRVCLMETLCLVLIPFCSQNPCEACGLLPEEVSLAGPQKAGCPQGCRALWSQGSCGSCAVSQRAHEIGILRQCL